METMKFRFMAIMLTTLACATVLAAPVRAESLGEQSSVARWVSAAQRVSNAEDSQRVTIAAYLSFRNQAVLKELIAGQSTPGHAQYGKYLTPRAVPRAVCAEGGRRCAGAADAAANGISGRLHAGYFY
jgi:hypothetical protein